MSDDFSAKTMRLFHPLRSQRWMWSDFNPAMAWLEPVAESVAANRHPADREEPPRQLERMFSELISASFDYYRDMRDANSEAAFYLIYGNVFALQSVDQLTRPSSETSTPVQPSDTKQVLNSIAEGGYAEAVCRARWFLARKGFPLPLAELEIRKDLLEDYADLLPKWTPDQRRRTCGRQEIICRDEPEKAIATLSMLLADEADRTRFLTFIDKLLADPRMNETVTAEQTKMVKRIRSILGAGIGAALRHAG
jgi:hypothetical protein